MKEKTRIGMALLTALALIPCTPVHAGTWETQGPNPPLYTGSPAIQRAIFKHHAHLQVINTLIQLDISDRQKTEIADILKANRSAMKAVHGSARNAFLHLAKEVTEHDPDERAIREASEVFSQTVEECAVFKAQLLRQIRSVLNDEQMAILTAKRQNLLNFIQTIKARGQRHEIIQTLDLWVNKHSSK